MPQGQVAKFVALPQKAEGSGTSGVLEIYVGRDVRRDADSQQSPIQRQPVRGVER